MVGEQKVSIVIEAVDKFSGTIKSAQGSMSGLTGFMQKNKVAIAATSAALIGFGSASLMGFGKLVVAAGNAEETISKFNTTFASVGPQSEAVAKDLRDNFGLASSSAKQLLADTGDLLSGFGFTGQEALDMAENVNKLAVDLASFTNIEGGSERASMALTKALLGERESIKELGIAILESDVQVRLAEKGMEGLTGMALKQAKAQVTLELAMEQSKNAIGDYARTHDSFANQLKLTKERTKELAESFGKVLLPVATRLLEIGLKIIDWFNNLSDATKKWMVYGGVLIAGLSLLAGVLLAVALAVVVLNVAMSPWLLIIGAVILVIAGLAAGLYYLYQKFEIVRNIVSIFWGLLKLSFLPLILLVKTAIEGAKMAFEFWAPVIQWVIDKIKPLIEWIKDLVGWLNKVTFGAFDNGSKSVDKATDSLKDYNKEGAISLGSKTSSSGSSSGSSSSDLKYASDYVKSPTIYLGSSKGIKGSTNDKGTIIFNINEVKGIDSRDLSEALARDMGNMIKV